MENANAKSAWSPGRGSDGGPPWNPALQRLMDNAYNQDGFAQVGQRPPALPQPAPQLPSLPTASLSPLPSHSFSPPHALLPSPPAPPLASFLPTPSPLPPPPSSLPPPRPLPHLSPLAPTPALFTPTLTRIRIGGEGSAAVGAGGEGVPT